MPKHSSARLGHWRAWWNPAVGAHRHPLRVNRCRVGFELTKQLLLRTHQPTLTTRFFRRGIGGAVFVRHGLESLLIPPNRFKDPPIRCEQPVALKTRFLQRGISSAVVVLHGVESGYFSQTLSAATRSAVAAVSFSKVAGGRLIGSRSTGRSD